jgi:hypothetical protein
MKKLFFPSLCFVLLVACTSPIAHMQKGTSTAVITKGNNASISEEGGKMDVFVSNMLTVPYNEASHPVVMDQEMYVAVNTKWGYLPNEVRKINLNTKREITIFKTEYHPSAINDLQGNREWLIWVDSTEDGYGNNIWVKNLKTEEMKKIYQQPEYSHIMIIPMLYDHYVAWPYEKNGVVKVCLMDLKTGKAEDIAQYHTFSFSNQVHKDSDRGRLIWTDSEDGVGFFKVFDFKTRQITTYPLPGYTPGHAWLLGSDYVLFKNSRDHFVNTVNPAVCIYNLKTKQYQILSEDKDNRDFRVAGNYIFYIRNGVVQSLLYKEGPFEKKTVPHQLQNPESIYTSNNYLILEKVNDRDGKSVSTTYEVIDLSQTR